MTRPSIHFRAAAAALALLLLSGVRAEAQETAAQDPGVAEALHLLDVWMDAAQAFGGIPGASLAVVHDQELVWAKGYGYAHVERREPAAPSTMYSICSISKLFTSVGVLQLRDQGKLALDDPVAKHLEWFTIKDVFPEAGPVTIEGLLTHSSGLPREAAAPYWTGPDYPFPTHDEIVERVSSQAMLYPPRTYFQYSNLALTLAGETVAAVSGHSFDEYVRANILDPLGMSSTFTDLEDRFRGNRLASGYTARGRDGERGLVPDYWVRGISPAAGFISTVEDLGRFASWQFRVLDGDDALLDRNTLREMHRVHWLEPDGETTYGLGFSVWKSDGDTFVGHGGSCPGYRSQLLLRPQDRIATTFMTNGQGVNARSFAQTAFDIMAPALRRAAKGESATTADAALQRYTGTYQRPLGGESAVLVWDGDLHVLSLPSGNPLDAMERLRHIEGDTFSRVRDNGDLGEEFIFEEMPDGAMRMWRNNNFSVRPAGL
ncbi:serine hydrolase [Candidatus Palauibacter sp.]|uniref:serine hydrolase n=1 Tax=Candidatus Palauibacter sp. TaxID=3101350 RepID=UPI003B594473